MFSDTFVLPRSMLTIASIIRSANPRSSSETTRKFDLLHELRVFSAPNMVIKPSIVQGQLGKSVKGQPIPCKVSFKDTGKELYFYIRTDAQTSLRLPVSELSSQMCSLCGIKGEKLQMLLTNVLLEDDVHEIDDMMFQNKIDGFEDYEYRAAPVQPIEIVRNVQATRQSAAPAREATEEAPETTKPTAETSTVRILSIEADSANPQVLRDISNEVQSEVVKPDTKCHGLGGLPTLSPEPNTSRPVKEMWAGFSTGPPQPALPQSKLPPQGSARLNDATRNTGAKRPSASFVDRPVSIRNTRNDTHAFDQETITITGPGPKRTPPLSPDRDGFRIYQDDDVREQEIGIRGELKIYWTLQNIFGGDLSQSCWTSELRALAGDEFKRWQPQDLATTYSDFTVIDSSWRLSAWLLEKNFSIPESFVAAMWSSDLIYHIEVKTTTSPYNEPFHMRAAQMEKCESFSAGSTTATGQDIFMIFRLYDLEKGGRLMVYVDPWQQIKEGTTLKRSPEAWLVTDCS